MTLTNSGTTTVSPVGIAIAGTAGADFSTTNTCNGLLRAGANCTINVTFTPTAAGTRTSSLTVSSSGNTQTIILTGAGTTPPVALSVTSLSFASQAVGGSGAPQNVTLSNTGLAALGISEHCAHWPQQRRLKPNQ